MASKTPVTILQELMVQRHDSPTYDLIFSEVGTHEPMFKYQVTGLGHTAIGNGKSKKEAKHEAARLLLIRLKERGIDQDRGTHIKLNDPLLEEVDSCYSPYDDTIKDNTVGALQTFCCENGLPLPKYDLIEDVGPPHFKKFTIRCSLSVFCCEASARTKKQAKHRCSANMLVKVKKNLSFFLESSDGSDNETEGPTRVSSLMRKTACFEYPLNDICQYLVTNPMISSTLEDLVLQKTKAEDIPNPIEILNKIADEDACKLDITEVPSDKGVKVNIFFVSKPGWSFIGTGDSFLDAQTKAARDALNFLIIMSFNDEDLRAYL